MNSKSLSDSLADPAAKHSIDTPLAELLKQNHLEANIYNKADSANALPEIVRKGLAGLEAAEFIKIQTGGPTALRLDIVHPIEGGSGRVEKVVLISRTLDKTFLSNTKQIIKADISLIFDNQIALTTLDGPDLEERFGQTILPLIKGNGYVSMEQCSDEFEYKDKIINTLLFPLPHSGHHNGMVAISIALPGIAMTREVLWRGTAVILMTLVILLLLTYAVFSMLITNPLRKLSSTVKEIANGKLDRQFEVNSADELSEVKAALNAIVSDLKKSKQEIQTLNREFEDKLNLKTKILQEQNQRLRSSDKKLKDILDQSEVGIFHLERNLNFEYLNATAAKICGLPMENILRQPITDLIRFSKPDEAMTCLARILEGRIGGQLFQAHLTRPDKNLLAVNIQCGPFYIDDEIAGIRGIIWEPSSSLSGKLLRHGVEGAEV